MLVAAGHDVCTVAAQGLQGAVDAELLRRCVGDGRALITLDLDFANPVRFSPAEHSGVAVLRMPNKATRAQLERGIATLVEALRRLPLAGQLWIVEDSRLRVYSPSA